MRKLILILPGLLLLTGCPDPVQPKYENKPASKQVVEPVAQQEKIVMYERPIDMPQLVRGGQLFKQNCASCHGDNAQGMSGWQKRDAQGKFPPPPLDGTGHSWHHPMAGIKHTIYFGTENNGGSMPGWKDKLTDAQIDDILAWIQAKWPDELYQAWAKNDLRSRIAKQKGK